MVFPECSDLHQSRGWGEGGGEGGGVAIFKGFCKGEIFADIWGETQHFELEEILKCQLDDKYEIQNTMISMKYKITTALNFLRGDMGWLRSVGSIKLYVSFAEYRLFCRALL